MPPMKMNTQAAAIVWLTYFDDPEADAAFARLSNEASQWGRVIKMRHDPQGSREPGASATLSINDGDLAAALPARFDRMQAQGRAVNQGFCDLLHFATVQKLPDFELYWFIEYDVDFSGSWGAFFAEFVECPADLLGTTLYSRSLSERWFHWPWFKSPAEVDERSVTRGFFPVNRLSRRFIEMYAREAERWEGHWEALFPSIALHAGLAVEDIGGEGPMTPPHRRGRLYSNSNPHRLEGTFRAYPPVDTHYFPNRGDAEPRNYLWHPIKTEAHQAEAATRHSHSAGRPSVNIPPSGFSVGDRS
jgi:hypothetical protein